MSQFNKPEFTFWDKCSMAVAGAALAFAAAAIGTIYTLKADQRYDGGTQQSDQGSVHEISPEQVAQYRKNCPNGVAVSMDHVGRMISVECNLK